MLGQWEFPEIDSQLFELQPDPRQISTDQESNQENKRFDNAQKQNVSIMMNPFLIVSSRGRRQTNLDYYDFLLTPGCWMVGLYDGHGDDSIAQYLKDHLLEKIFQHQKFRSETQLVIKQCFEQIEQQLYRKYHQRQKLIGSTALLVIIFPQKFYIVNLGDSAVLGRKKQFTSTQKNKTENISSQQTFYKDKQDENIMKMNNGKNIIMNGIFLNSFHNLENEEQFKSVNQMGAIIIKRGGKLRIGGEIDLTRSFGDFKYKNNRTIYSPKNLHMKTQKKFSSEKNTQNDLIKIPSPISDNFHKGLSSQPSIHSYLTNDFTQLILGTDGLWNIFTNTPEKFEKIIKKIENQKYLQSELDIFHQADDNSTMILLDLSKFKI